MKRLRMRLGSRCWKSALALGSTLTACSGSGKLTLGEVLSSDGTGGSIGTGGGVWIATDAGYAVDASCAAKDLEPITPALYMVVDRSNDMQVSAQNSPQQPPKWADLLVALAGSTGYLASDPAKLWSSVGLGYYPNPCQLHPPGGGCPNNTACSLASYQPLNAPNQTFGIPERVANYLNLTPIGPGGPTTMRLALQGALDDVIPPWERDHPAQFAVPVIVAADTPQSSDCQNQMNSVGDVVDVANNAQTRNDNAHSRTFVIGFETDPDNTTQFNRIADAGGTSDAYIIPENTQSASQQLASALEDIRQRSCMFKLPPGRGGGLSLRRPGQGSMQPDTIGVLQNRSGCGQDPEHLYQVYYDLDDPSRIIGCDKLCQDYTASVATGGTVQLLPVECVFVQPPMR